MAASLGSALRRYSNVNLYISAGGLAEGINVHNDGQCVFIYQVHGSKRWRLWNSTEIGLMLHPGQSVSQFSHSI